MILAADSSRTDSQISFVLHNLVLPVHRKTSRPRLLNGATRKVRNETD